MSNNKPQVSLQAYMRSGAVQQRIEALLDKRAPQFTASLMTVINSNLKLQECSPESVLTSAITAASMDLPLNPNLGFAYIVPYNNKKKIKVEETNPKTGEVVIREKSIWVVEAQFQMGYKGFIQLAQRSGNYKTINAVEVREGEFKGENKLTGELEFEWMTDEKEREKKAVVGYVSYFKLISGFEKSMYMSIEKMKKHAKQYSQSYKKGFGMWVDDFDKMARKTVIKLLISGYGPMSTQMQEAILADQASLGEDDMFHYVDNEKNQKADQESDNGSDDGGTEEQKKAETEAVSNNQAVKEQEENADK